MKENKYTNEDLKIMQSWSLERKIQVTQTRIIEWYIKYKGKVYISFSGGKDSTVLLDLARRIYPDIDAVFIDTGLEYPELKDFVKIVDNVIWLKPKINFKQVINKYGYPVISKEVALKVDGAKRNPNGYSAQSFYEGSPKNIKYPTYKLTKYEYLLHTPFKISHKCCDIMKKKPAKEFEKSNGKYPIIGTMTEESSLRKTEWLKNGCNAFEKDRPTSQPISFWTEQDILQYLKEFNIPYASVYGEIIEVNGKLKTTKCDRTGCVFCGFGCHLEKEPNRFQRLKLTHPKLWEYCMKSWDDGGLGMKEVLDYIGVKYE